MMSRIDTNPRVSPSTVRLRASARIVAKFEQTAADGVCHHEVEQHQPAFSCSPRRV
jgi:hypothetical protein